MSELYLQAPGASIKADERRFLKELAEKTFIIFDNPVLCAFILVD